MSAHAVRVHVGQRGQGVGHLLDVRDDLAVPVARDGGGVGLAEAGRAVRVREGHHVVAGRPASRRGTRRPTASAGPPWTLRISGYFFAGSKPWGFTMNTCTGLPSAPATVISSAGRMSVSASTAALWVVRRRSGSARLLAQVDALELLRRADAAARDHGERGRRARPRRRRGGRPRVSTRMLPRGHVQLVERRAALDVGGEVDLLRVGAPGDVADGVVEGLGQDPARRRPRGRRARCGSGRPRRRPSSACGRRGSGRRASRQGEPSQAGLDAVRLRGERSASGEPSTATVQRSALVVEASSALAVRGEGQLLAVRRERVAERAAQGEGRRVEVARGQVADAPSSLRRGRARARGCAFRPSTRSNGG